VKVIAGLGNPGREYERTPHNIGFDVVEELRLQHAAEWSTSRRFKARVAKTTLAGEQVLLVQPLTFMNLSGASVASLLRYHGGTLNDLVVVLDDADLPLGRIRVKPDGGSGGHRGLASIIEAAGDGAFARVRLGVGRNANHDLVGHVLRAFDTESWKQARVMTLSAAEAIECLLAHGVAEAMNRFNGRELAETTLTGSEQKGL
jgi:PTH1 family peptidyl-tRNA hydrolase